MSHIAPALVSRETLLTILRDITDRVERGDSDEGGLNYMLAEDYQPGAVEFEVSGGYRVGNLQGQGGFRLIGERAQ